MAEAQQGLQALSDEYQKLQQGILKPFPTILYL